jgi:cell division protein FtsB
MLQQVHADGAAALAAATAAARQQAAAAAAQGAALEARVEELRGQVSELQRREQIRVDTQARAKGEKRTIEALKQALGDASNPP